MSTAHWWTGIEVRALREALLMPVRSFADHLGVGVTTVSDWEQKGPDARLRLSSQRLLADHLARASEDVRKRFDLALYELKRGATERHGRDGGIASATTVGHDIGNGQTQAIEILGASLGVSQDEAHAIAGLAGTLVELDLCLSIDIDSDGEAKLLYQHKLLNVAGRPATRMIREVWFKHTSRRISISPVAADDLNVVIQRVHDAPTLAKFACQVSPAVQPGDTALVQYTVEGGRFVDEFYWRQSTPRYVGHMTIELRHRGAGPLRSCAAIEEHPDGSENSAGEGLTWRYEGLDLVVKLSRSHLRPNQALTLRWDVDRETP